MNNGGRKAKGNSCGCDIGRGGVKKVEEFGLGEGGDSRCAWEKGGLYFLSVIQMFMSIEAIAMLIL